MKTVWFLFWCVGNVLNPGPNDGCLAEGPADWLREHKADGTRVCFPGECNTGAVCEERKKDLFEKALKANTGVAASCGLVCENGKFHCD